MINRTTVGPQNNKSMMSHRMVRVVILHPYGVDGKLNADRPLPIGRGLVHRLVACRLRRRIVRLRRRISRDRILVHRLVQVRSSVDIGMMGIPRVSDVILRHRLFRHH